VINQGNNTDLSFTAKIMGVNNNFNQTLMGKTVTIYGNLSHTFEWQFRGPSIVKRKQVFKGKSGRFTASNLMN
jgi:hypothetical protein